MTSTLTVTRVTGQTRNYETGGLDDELETVYSGPGRIQTYEPQESRPEAGDHSYVIQRYSAHLPVGAGPFRVNDQITVDADPLDPALVGRIYRVVSLFNKSQATAQRIPVEEVVA